MILEVCAGSYSDCVNAYCGGATRVELNSALSLGGLTPSVATLRNVKREMSLEVACMVRNRGAGFCYSNREKNCNARRYKNIIGKWCGCHCVWVLD